MFLKLLMNIFYLQDLNIYIYIYRQHRQDVQIDNKNIVAFKKHFRVQVPGLDGKRNFNFDVYGSRKLAALAAAEFERYAKVVLYDFEELGRKPNQRRAMLDAHGCETKYNSKPIRVQRCALCHNLVAGDSTVMEKEIVDSVWKKHHDEEVLQKTSVAISKATSKFVVDFAGAKQQIQQSFKTLQLAADWAVGMNAAEKDSRAGMRNRTHGLGCESGGIYTYILGDMMYIYMCMYMSICYHVYIYVFSCSFCR